MDADNVPPAAITALPARLLLVVSGVQLCDDAFDDDDDDDDWLWDDDDEEDEEEFDDTEDDDDDTYGYGNSGY